MTTHRLYPAIEPRSSGHLAVEAPHAVYWEDCGNPNGVPVCFLHGGPGAGTGPGHRRFFDPSFYRIVLHDQRGCGRSTPRAEITNNDTGRLIEDIEALRKHLKIDKWIVFGGSWGASLSLAYAQAHPDRCLGVVLRGVFLCRKQEVEWFLNGMGKFFPAEHATLLAGLPEEERQDPLAAYYKILTNPDPAIHEPAAAIWNVYETACSALRQNPQSLRDARSPVMAVPLARLECHYFINGMFMPEGALLDNVERIRHLPAIIIQGRYDVICPPTNAYELATAWPEASLRFVDDAGHSAMEPGILSGLVEAMEEMKSLVGENAG